ncbi:hypothetical protein RB195_011341 [Necator americanus]|uniref:Endonuclease/exonuclease/phosphatase domain-containing protein n=1 Tax=Necator americanus TaxID=51031 RepID=A0ABR1D343_NECAM
MLDVQRLFLEIKKLLFYFNPQQIVTDEAPCFDSGLRAVFPEARTKLHYWHIDQTFKRSATRLVATHIRGHVKKDLSELFLIADLTLFESRFGKVLAFLEIESQTGMVNYLEENNLGKTASWASFANKGAVMDTTIIKLLIRAVKYLADSVAIRDRRRLAASSFRVQQSTECHRWELKDYESRPGKVERVAEMKWELHGKDMTEKYQVKYGVPSANVNILVNTETEEEAETIKRIYDPVLNDHENLSSLRLSFTHAHKIEVKRRKKRTKSTINEQTNRDRIPQVGPAKSLQLSDWEVQGRRLPKRKRTKITTCTYNARTLASDVVIEDLVMQARKFKYDVIGLTETRQRHPLNALYENGEGLFLGKCDNRGVIGVGVFVSTNIAVNIGSFKQLTTRIGRRRRCGPASLDHLYRLRSNIKLLRRGSRSFLYGPREVLQRRSYLYKVIVGDFNAKIGPRTTSGELNIETHGLQRNEEGERLSEFIMTTKTIHGNPQFQKPSSLRWTWESSGGGYHNEIDHIIVSKRFCLTDVAVVPRFYRDRTIAFFQEDFLSHGEEKKPRSSLSELPEPLSTGSSWLRLSGFGKIPSWTTSTPKTLELILRPFARLRLRKTPKRKEEKTLDEQLQHREGGWKRSFTASTQISSTATFTCLLTI